jgi:hypothetical protein
MIPPMLRLGTSASTSTPDSKTPGPLVIEVERAAIAAVPGARASA